MSVSLNNERTLVRRLTLRNLIFLGLGYDMATGALFSATAIVSAAGPEGIITYLVAGLFYSALGVIFIELSRVYPEAGSVTRFTLYSHGRTLNLINGFADLIWYLFIPPVEAISVSYTLNVFFPYFINSAGDPTIYGAILGFGIVLLMLPVNYFGISRFGRATNYISAVKIALYLTVPIALILFVHNSANLLHEGGFVPFGIGSMFAILPLAMYNFGGSRMIPDFAEETTKRSYITLGIIIAILTETAIYTLLAVAVVLGTNWSAIHLAAGSWHSLKGLAANPFLVFSKSTGLEWLLVITLIVSVLSPYISGYISVGAGTRALFSMGRSGLVGDRIKAIHEKYAIPVWSLVVFIVVGGFLALVSAPAPSIYNLIDDATAAGYLGFAAIPVAMIVSRRQKSTSKLQRIRGGNILAPVAMGVSSLIAYWAGWPDEPYAVLLIMAASLLFGIYSKATQGLLNSIWYICYMGFITLMVAIGTEGLYTLIPNSIGPFVVFAVTVALFYPWGVFSGLEVRFKDKEFTEFKAERFEPE